MIRGVTPLSLSVAENVGGPGRCTVVRLAGEADVTSAELGQALRAAAGKRPRVLAVEVSGLTFIDSGALHVIIGVHRDLTGAGCAAVLVGLSGSVARVVALTGVDQVIPAVASVAEAVALATAGGGTAG